MGVIRVACLSDTHLGFDLPARARVQRRRRGPDFFRNYQLALEAAREHRADVVIHAGDVLFRSRVRPQLVLNVVGPLFDTAEQIPVIVIPGNHERSAFPFPLLWKHPNVTAFERPGSLRLQIRSSLCRITGIPFMGRGIRRHFGRLCRTLLNEPASPGVDLDLLVIHELIEGARVGPIGHAFAAAPDVLSPRQFPTQLAAVLCGHIHRHQVLEGSAVNPPILLPGSCERTSFAEQDEAKGFLLLDFWKQNRTGRYRLANWEFVELPTRPMVTLRLPALSAGSPRDSCRWVGQKLATLPPDSVVRLQVPRETGKNEPRIPSAEMLRSVTPRTMTVQFGGLFP